MALNVANWTDKQLDELADLLQASDYSAVAGFISENFLCSDAVSGRIMTDPTDTTLKVTVNSTNTKSVDLSAGIFLLGGKVSQIDSAEVINILDPTQFAWGGAGVMGQASHATLDRWSIICVKNKSRPHTSALRWFVDDTVDPNIYAKQPVNTLIDKAYYDIKVVHGTEAGSPTVPDAPAGYWTIAEIFVPHTASAITVGDIYWTGDLRGSQKTPVNWTTTTRVLRLEFWSTLFGIDHDLTTGYHRSGGWHIGTTLIDVTGVELNTALSGINPTYVTAVNLTKLTDGTVLPLGALHSHGSGTMYDRVQTVYAAAIQSLAYGSPLIWVDLTGMTLTFTTTDIFSFLMLYNAENITYWNIAVRFVIDGTPISPSTDAEAWYFPTPYFASSFSNVAIATAPGVHVLKMQGAGGHPYGSGVRSQRFIAIRF